MADSSGMFRTPALQGWQRANVVAAANCLREQIARTPDDSTLRTAYEGLLDLLDPSRQLASAVREAASGVKPERSRLERRHPADRRRVNLGAPGGAERRTGIDRRSGRDRRAR